MPLPPYLTADRLTIEALSRRGSRAVPFGDETVLCRVLDRYLLYGDARDVGIIPHLCFSGIWEPWLTLALAREVKTGFYCLDVGANHGYYTLLMADGVGPGGCVLAVEPTHKPAALLRLSLSVNGVDRSATVLEKAVGDKDGERVTVAARPWWGLNARIEETSAPDAHVFDVETATIDSLTADWPRVDLIKIDVEGAEEAVWRGMQQTLERHRRAIVFLEINVDRYENDRAFISSIEGAGFPLRYVAYDGQITDTSADEILTVRRGEDWMLYLSRREEDH
jgi:FkbM family methyltransferase